MFLKLLSLEWKSFIRSASFKTNLVLKIFLGFIGLYFAVTFLMLGYFLVDLIQEMNLETFKTINRYVLYYLFIDLVVRFMFQKLPVTTIRPLLAQPILKRKIILYTLGKSFNSFFIWLHLFLLIPLAFRLVTEGYNATSIILWTLSIFCFLAINNLLNLLLQNKTSILVVIIGVIAATASIHYFTTWDYLAYTGAFFSSFYSFNWLFSLAALAVIGIGFFTYHVYLKNLYLDAGMAVATKDRKEWHWLQKLHAKDPFLQNDVRLLLRNKRSRSTLLLSIVFLGYGLMFFKNVDITSLSASTSSLLFSLFVSGGFIFTFGQYVPSWDSAYYPLFMTQNVKYKAYLDSKWRILVIGGLVSSALSFLYLFLDFQLLYPLLAGIAYNLGINTQLALLTGAYIRTPIDLSQNKNIFGNKQAFNLQTMLISLPMFLLPMLILFVASTLSSIKIGFIVIICVGICGFAMKNVFFNRIVKIYKKHKYITLQSYKEVK